MSLASTPTPVRPPRARLVPFSVSLPLLAVVTPLVVAALLDGWLGPPPSLTDTFFQTQDLWPVVGMAGLLLALSFAPAPRSRTPERAWATPRAAAIALACALAAGLAGWVGAHLVMDGHPLSADEVMARFDGAILRGGHLLAPVAPEWRRFEVALAPSFMLPSAGATHWSSNYLPVNAASQALAGLLGDPALAGAAWTALAVLATFGVARRLWPERPERAWVAAVLLASSAQTVLNGMTAYAMPAHLALNMVWLWLFLDRRWPGQVAAAGVAFLACGLHQVVFHPLFAAAFVLDLWVGRRWGRAVFHTLAYGAIGLFWLGWFPLASHLEGTAIAPHATTLLKTLENLFKHWPTDGVLLMVANVLRWISWQNPLAPPLWVLGALAAWKGRGVERALVAAPLITFAAVFALMPYQGHGWGYRYLHGCDGAVALGAALGFSRLLDRRDAAGRRALWTGWSVGLGAAVLVLLPLRMGQAHAWVAPYARAEAAIRRSNADAVVIDSDGVYFGLDLTRNDPFLRDRPRVFAIEGLTGALAAELCSRGSVAVFDREDARRLGMKLWPSPPKVAEHDRAVREVMADLGCGTRLNGQPGLRASSTNSL